MPTPKHFYLLYRVSRISFAALAAVKRLPDALILAYQNVG